MRPLDEIARLIAPKPSNQPDSQEGAGAGVRDGGGGVGGVHAALCNVPALEPDGGGAAADARAHRPPVKRGVDDQTPGFRGVLEAK